MIVTPAPSPSTGGIASGAPLVLTRFIGRLSLDGALLHVYQTALVLALAPLLSGIVARAEAILQSRRGPSVFQPYFDLWKYLHKQTVRPRTASPLFRIAPPVAFGSVVFVSLVVPVVVGFPLPFAFSADLLYGAFFLVLSSFVVSLAGLDASSPYGNLGSSRAIFVGAVSEPTLILVFFNVGLLSQSDNPYVLNHALATSPLEVLGPAHLFTLFAFFLILLAENGHVPISGPGGHMELGMIDEARVLEYSGPELALLSWTSDAKQFVMFGIFVNVFFLPWGGALAAPSLGPLLGSTGLVLLEMLVVAALVVIVDTSFSKLRLFRIAEYFGASFALALVSLLTVFLGGGF